MKPSFSRRAGALLTAATLTLGATAFAASAKPKPAATSAKSSLAVPGKKVTALIFIARDCPISNAYALELARLDRDFTPRGVAFRFVYEDTKSLADAKKHARDFGLPGAISIDPKGALAKSVGATVTPEAVVVTSSGAIVYRGRISDLYADYGKRRRAATTHDLRDALSGALQKNASTRLVTTKAIGCFIASEAGE